MREWARNIAVSIVLVFALVIMFAPKADAAVKYTNVGYTTIQVDGVLLLKDDGKVHNFTKNTTAFTRGDQVLEGCPSCEVIVYPAPVRMDENNPLVCPEPTTPVEPECPVEPEPEVPTDPVDPPVEPEEPVEPEVPAVEEVMYRINVGGELITIDGGLDWAADPTDNLINAGSDYTETSVLSVVDPSVDPSTPPAIFNTRRTDSGGGDEIQYTFSVPNGEYEVSIFVIDSYYSDAGRRVQKFDIEGQLSDGYDPVASFGKGGGGVHTLDTAVTDGSLDLIFNHVEGKGNTTVSGIQITRKGDTDAEPTDPTPPSSVLLGEVTISWDTPTTRQNGNPLSISEIHGIRLQWTHEDGVVDHFDMLMDIDYAPYKLLQVRTGQNCFILQTSDTNFVKSVWTEPLCKMVTVDE